MSPTSPSLPPRPRDAHKGSFGTALLAGGSRGMGGAIVLAGRAALRSGVGLCRVALPASLQAGLPADLPEATSLGLPEEEGALGAGAAAPFLAAARSASAVGIGPGLSQAAGCDAFLRAVLAELALPLVLDADALNLCARWEEGPAVLRARAAPTLLTPHPGEAARLLAPVAGTVSAHDVQRDRAGAARRLSELSGAVVLLKGAGTIVDDGTRSARNETGNPGMATGGSGDVLCGICCALLARGMDAFDAGRLGAHVHGLAGDLVAREGSQTGLIAGDLVAALPRAFALVERG